MKALESQGIYSRLWLPDNRVQSSMVLVHGLGEHSARYGDEFAAFFTQHGYAIQTFDLPGHGLSKGKRGHVESYSDFEKILSLAIQHLKAAYPHAPVYLYGHSLGGLIVLDYVYHYPENIRGYICSAPVLDVFQPINPVKKFLAKFLQRLLPSFTMDSDLEVHKLSKDEAVVQKYLQDPLVHPKTSSNLAMYIIERGAQLRRKEQKPDVSGLFIVGSEEGIVNKQAIVDYCSSNHVCTLKVWDGLFHELHNEPEKDLVFSFANTWMQNQENDPASNNESS